MFTLSVVFGNASVGFVFKTQEAAEKAAEALSTKPPAFAASAGLDSLPMNNRREQLQQISEPNLRLGSILIEDDFGQRGTFNLNSVHGVILEDMERTKVARSEQMVHQMKCQMLARKLSSADPALRMMNSPAMIDPMGGNGLMR